MKKTLSLVVMGVMLVLTLGVLSATPPVCNENSGAIWTTKGDCGIGQQDVNQFSVGEKVFINGDNFCANNYNWSIKKVSGGPEKPVVASGNKTVDSSGAFCFEAYTVQAGDSGEYSVDFGKKNDNYHVFNPTNVPEFETTVGIVTVLGALGVFFLVRRK